MIDLHTHILPAMDDGSKDPEESLALVKTLAAQGVKEIYATPHFYAKRENPDSFLARREAAAAQLLGSEALGQLPVHIDLGAEVAYFSGISHCEDLQAMTLGETKLLLVEMPFSPWDHRILTDICSIPANLGLIPVLAHVDRYRKADQFPKHRRLLANNDVLFQCNADVFDTFGGRLWATRAFRDGDIHFLGSDCHNMGSRAPRLTPAIHCLTKRLGPDALERFFDQAHALLEIN